MVFIYYFLCIQFCLNEYVACIVMTDSVFQNLITNYLFNFRIVFFLLYNLLVWRVCRSTIEFVYGNLKENA